MSCIFSVDVEDWFHILDLPSTPSIDRWNSLESHVEKDFFVLLDMMQKADVTSTCFFLGWVAERFPDLVKAAAEAGHEIGSHGYGHELVYELDAQAFRDDIQRAKDAIESACGRQVKGYRAPGFSFTAETPWVYEQLANAGYQYSSSVFPASRGHGGISDAEMDPFFTDEGVAEFPISVVNKFGKRLCLFGGGYLRLFPGGMVRKAARGVLRSGRIVNFYIHPREINPSHPRLEMSRLRRFKTYVNLTTTEGKLSKLFHEFDFTTFEQELAKLKKPA